MFVCVFAAANKKQRKTKRMSHNLCKTLLEASGAHTLQTPQEIARSMEVAEGQAKLIENDSTRNHVHALDDKQCDLKKNVSWKATSVF